MEKRKLTESIEIWATPLPLFQQSLLGNVKPLKYHHPPTRTRKTVRSINLGESKSSHSRRGMIAPGTMGSTSPLVETMDHATLTVPIELETEGTQTDLEFQEGVPEVETTRKSIIDRATSPINLGNDKPLFEELEQITGHIVIQKFITRSQEEFQQLIKIRFPGMRVVETVTTHTGSNEVHLEDESEKDQGRPGSSVKVCEPECSQNEESDLDIKADTCGPITEDKVMLECDAITEISEDQDQSDSEDEPSMVEIKEVVLSPFTVSKSQSVPTRFEMTADVHRGHDTDEDEDDNQSAIEVVDTTVGPSVEVLEMVPEPVQEEEVEVQFESGDSPRANDTDTVGPDEIPENGIAQERGILEEDPVQLDAQSEVDFDLRDIEDQIVPSSVQDQQSLSYGLTAEAEEIEDIDNELNDDEINYGSEIDMVPLEVMDPLHKSVATQTISRSAVRLRCCHGRRIHDSAESANSSGPSVLDLQLRVQKFDVRLRVGRPKGQARLTSSLASGERSDHLDILQFPQNRKKGNGKMLKILFSPKTPKLSPQKKIHHSNQLHLDESTMSLPHVFKWVHNANAL